jgi:hypothetical protein
MRIAALVFLVFLTVFAAPALPQEASKPMNKNQVMALLKAGMENQELAKKVEQFGIDFEPTDEYLQALRQAGAQEVLIQALRTAHPKPLTREQVLELLAGHVPSQRAAVLVSQRGIDFVPDEEYFGTLRFAGAEDVLLAAVRAAGEAVPAQLEVATSPSAEVYLDGQLAGRADNEGRLDLSAKHGAHLMKVSLAGKQDFVQTVSLTPGKANQVSAVLTDLSGSVLVRTSPGGEVFLDNVSKGQANASGELVIPGVSPGTHALRVTAPGKTYFGQSITVVAGQASNVDAALADLPATVATAPSQPTTGRGIGKQEILSLLAGGAPSERIAKLVVARGLSFQPTDSDLNDILRAGGDEVLIKIIRAVALRRAEEIKAQIDRRKKD